MEKHEGLFAVLTGDIFRSTKFSARFNEMGGREKVLQTLKGSFLLVDDLIPNIILSPFEIYRGDSFQGVISRPEEALSAALLIRASLRKSGLQYEFIKRKKYALDARIAIGIGTIDSLPAGKGSEGDGEAFRNSGPILDKMKKDKRLSVETPWKEANAEFEPVASLIDALIKGWTAEQAQAIVYYITDWTQEKIASELGISQPAVRLRLERAGGNAIKMAIERYKFIIREYKP